MFENLNQNNNKKIKEEVVKMQRYSKTNTYKGFKGAAAFDCSSDVRRIATAFRERRRKRGHAAAFERSR